MAAAGQKCLLPRGGVGSAVSAASPQPDLPRGIVRQAQRPGIVSSGGSGAAGSGPAAPCSARDAPTRQQAPMRQTAVAVQRVQSARCSSPLTPGAAAWGSVAPRSSGSRLTRRDASMPALLSFERHAPVPPLLSSEPGSANSSAPPTAPPTPSGSDGPLPVQPSSVRSGSGGPIAAGLFRREVSVATLLPTTVAPPPLSRGPSPRGRASPRPPTASTCATQPDVDRRSTPRSASPSPRLMAALAHRSGTPSHLAVLPPPRLVARPCLVGASTVNGPSSCRTFSYSGPPMSTHSPPAFSPAAPPPLTGVAAVAQKVSNTAAGGRCASCARIR